MAGMVVLLPWGSLLVCKALMGDFMLALASMVNVMEVFVVEVVAVVGTEAVRPTAIGLEQGSVEAMDTTTAVAMVGVMEQLGDRLMCEVSVVAMSRRGVLLADEEDT